MAFPSSFVKTSIFWIAVIAVPLGVFYLLLAAVGLAPTPYTCITEMHGKVSDVAGFDFEVSETDCDTLAKDASISVFASKAGQAHKTLLFKYGPAGGDPFPLITPIDQHSVQISVPWISDVIFRRDGLKDLSVVYKIGVIEYPDANIEKNK
jgi:hypothetical protein